MKTATLTITTRTRRIRLAIALVRVAAFLHSMRLARFAVRLVRVEYRVENSPRWIDVPVNIEVTRA